MANDDNENDLRVRWQRQQPEGEDMSVNEVRVRAQKFQKRIRNENIFQYAVLIGVGVWLVGSILLFKPVMIIQVALGLLVAGSLAIGYHLHKRRSSRALPRDLGLLPSVEFHCRELDRERDAQQSILSWYILPVIPGLSVLIVALALGGPGRGVVPAAVLAAAFAAVFTFVLHRAQRTARRLQGEIDELRAYGR